MSTDDKSEVLSVIKDVDALLESSGTLSEVKTGADDSTDVMKELDEIINS